MEQSYLTRQVEQICHEKNYISTLDIKILALTFNVNAKIEELENMPKLFKFKELQPLDSRADIVIIGLQEVVELSATNVVSSAVLGNATENLAKWIDMFLYGLNYGVNDRTDSRYGSPSYIIHTINQMVGTAAIMFILPDLESRILNLQKGTIPRGMGNVLGNKGGVCIRFDIEDTSICFIISHLSAHRENVTKRNDDYYAIITAPIFQSYEYEKRSKYTDSKLNTLQKDIKNIRSKLPLYLTSKFPLLSDELSTNNMYTPDDHDVIIWLGDLNYRIHENIHIDNVYEMIYTNKLDTLALSDQLIIERENSQAFENFYEGYIYTLNPTYQYIPGCNAYDRRPEKKMRCPAWCDRILWRIGKGTEKMKSYLLNNTISTSMIYDLMKLPFPSDILYVNPEPLHYHTTTTTTTTSATNTTGGMSTNTEDDTITTTIANNNYKANSTTNNNNNNTTTTNNNNSAPINIYNMIKIGGRDNLSDITIEELQAFLKSFYYHNNIEVIELYGFDVCDSLLSDHKPVKALLNVTIKSVDYGLREKSLIEAMSYYLKEKSQFLPLMPITTITTTTTNAFSSSLLPTTASSADTNGYNTTTVLTALTANSEESPRININNNEVINTIYNQNIDHIIVYSGENMDDIITYNQDNSHQYNSQNTENHIISMKSTDSYDSHISDIPMSQLTNTDVEYMSRNQLIATTSNTTSNYINSPSNATIPEKTPLIALAPPDLYTINSSRPSVSTHTNLSSTLWKTSLHMKISGHLWPLQKALLYGSRSPITVSPTALIISPTLSHGFHHITLTNVEQEHIITFKVLESTIPPWLHVHPYIGQLRPYESAELTLQINHNVLPEVQKHQFHNLENLLVLHYFISTNLNELITANSTVNTTRASGSSVPYEQQRLSATALSTSSSTTSLTGYYDINRMTSSNSGIPTTTTNTTMGNNNNNNNTYMAPTVSPQTQYTTTNNTTTTTIPVNNTNLLYTQLSEQLLYNMDKLLIPIGYGIYTDIK